MAFQYKDTNDLIQNQRALAELVGLINEKFDLSEDIAKELTDKLNALQTSVDAYIAACNKNVSDHTTDMQDELDTLTNRIKDMETWINSLGNIIVNPSEPAKEQETLGQLLGQISYLVGLLEGYKSESTGEWVDGWIPRVDRMEKRFPTIQIFENDIARDSNGNQIHAAGCATPIADRYPEVLYGVKTEVVPDYKEGTNVKISPYLQGVIREMGKN